MADYKIGQFTFTTEEEYRKAQKEITFIKMVKDKYNIDDAKVARVIIGKFQPETIIGEKFVYRLRKTCEEDDIFNAIDEELAGSEEDDDERYVQQLLGDYDDEEEINDDVEYRVLETSMTKPSSKKSKPKTSVILIVIAILVFVPAAYFLIKDFGPQNKKADKDIYNEKDTYSNREVEQPAQSTGSELNLSKEATDFNDVVYLNNGQEILDFISDENNIGRVAQFEAELLMVWEDEQSYNLAYYGNSQNGLITCEGLVPNVNLDDADYVIFKGKFAGNTNDMQIAGEWYKGSTFKTLDIKEATLLHNEVSQSEDNNEEQYEQQKPSIYDSFSGIKTVEFYNEVVSHSGNVGAGFNILGTVIAIDDEGYFIALEYGSPNQCILYGYGLEEDKDVKVGDVVVFSGNLMVISTKLWDTWETRGIVVVE